MKLNSSNQTKIGLLALVMFMISCKPDTPKNNLKNGDLLFCGYTQNGLSGAIDKVTQTNENTHFSHVGILTIETKDTFVIHASTKKGVAKDRFSTFLKEQEAAQIVVYRIQQQYLTSIDSILKEANTYIGLPYNFTYLPADSGYYCSQLIATLFSNQNVFELEPMTFKDPETGNFNTVWVEHYKKLNIPIPEGLPGCNPNGLAASNKISRISEIR